MPEDTGRRLVIEIGEPGVSDLVRYELEHVARQLGVEPHQAAMLMLGMGLAAGEASGMFTRATPLGTGLDPDWRPPAGDGDE